jgi:hypothetical protein
MKGKLKVSDLAKWMKTDAPIAGKSDGGGLTFTLSAAGTGVVGVPIPPRRQTAPTTP